MERRRRVMDRSGEPETSGHGKEVERLHIVGRLFVLIYTKCGGGCSVCRREGVNYQERRPGHGPYWYELSRRQGKLRRRYIGKELVKEEQLLFDFPRHPAR